MVLGYVLLKFVQKSDASYIIGRIVAKDHWNTLENVLRQNYQIKFLHIAHKNGPWKNY